MLSVLLALPLLAGPGPSTTAPTVADAVQKLRAWSARGRRSRDGLDDEQFDRLRQVLYEVRVLRDVEPERTIEIDLALLDLAALGWVGRERSDQGTGSRASLSALGLEELERRFRLESDRFGAWLANEVLQRPRMHRTERRIAAATLLRERYLKSTLPILMSAGRAETGELREALLDALVGWPDPVVHRFFLGSLQPSGVGLTHLAAHLVEIGDVLGPAARDSLRDLCGRLYVSNDWRAAARARHLVRALDADRTVPILIEALATWHRRGTAGRGSRRILHEILTELQRVSGRRIGPHPDRWNRWWTAVQAGRVDLPEDLEADGAYVSSATFFGLRPVSDKVVFVIDRSGSMDTVFGTDGTSRYEEAIDQFVRYLHEAGTDTRFSVVLFGDEARAWRTSLSSATDANLASASRWLRQVEPRGGTNIFSGVSAALRLDRHGRLDPEHIEVDTVVVLCDGATDAGKAWVDPWVRHNNEIAQIVFHCVQIGRGGDGTLDDLAGRTGGQMVQHAR